MPSLLAVSSASAGLLSSCLSSLVLVATLLLPFQLLPPLLLPVHLLSRPPPLLPVHPPPLRPNPPPPPRPCCPFASLLVLHPPTFLLPSAHHCLPQELLLPAAPLLPLPLFLPLLPRSALLLAGDRWVMPFFVVTVDGRWCSVHVGKRRGAALQRDKISIGYNEIGVVVGVDQSWFGTVLPEVLSW